MKSFKQHILLESTYDIDEDVDYIYDNSLDTFYKQLMLINVEDAIVPDYKIPSYDLPSEKAQEASFYKPIDIIVSDFSGTGWAGAYEPEEQTLKINIPMDEVRLLWNKASTTDFVYSIINDKFKKAYINIFKGREAKAVISHELTHWIDDAMFGEISKMAALADKYWNDYNDKMFEKISAKIIDPARFHELNAQIHQIKTMKKTFAKKWDKWTVDDVIMNSGTLLQAHNDQIPIKRAIWRKALITRMAREGLLGKNMTKTKRKI